MQDFYQQALDFDSQDKLAHFKNMFVNDNRVIYLDGNSLGKLPLKTEERTINAIRHQWGEGLIRSWQENWLELSGTLAAKIAGIVGAQKDEIFVGDTTSLNLYKLVFAALKHNSERRKIVSDSLNFPSDLYVIQGLVKNQFKNHSLLLMDSEDEMSVNENTLNKSLDDNTALLTLCHVTFKHSYMYDMKKITQLAHDQGSLVLWDLCHSAGVVDVQLNKSAADMAVGCTYKFLNGGPGAPAFLYVRKDLQKKLVNPIHSWFSHENPFDFDLQYKQAAGIEKFAVSTPPVIALSAMEPALDIILEAGTDNIRQKSVKQSQFLFEMIEKELAPLGFELASPSNINYRGSHVSIRHKDAMKINRAMLEPENGGSAIIADFRPPDIIRIGIAPLYNSFMDLYECVKRIRECHSLPARE